MYVYVYDTLTLCPKQEEEHVIAMCSITITLYTIQCTVCVEWKLVSWLI